MFFTVVRRFAHYRLWEVALLAGTAVLGNFAFRSLQDWLLVMLALGVPHLKELLAHAAHQDWRRPLIRRVLRIDAGLKRLVVSPLFRWQPAWPAMTLVALLLLSLMPPVSRGMPLQDSPEWPVAALDHIEHTGLTGRFFAPPDYGAYVTWRLGDRARIYTDTRGFFFPPVLLEDSVLDSATWFRLATAS